MVMHGISELCSIKQPGREVAPCSIISVRSAAAAFQRDSGGYYQDYDDENHSGLGSVRGLFIGLGSYGVHGVS